MHRRLGAAAYLVHTRYGFARMLVERGYDGDYIKSLELARKARDSANDMGMTLAAEQAASLIANLAGR